jgi:hypothetical protein
MAAVPSVRDWLHRCVLPVWVLCACVVFLAAACGSARQTAGPGGATTGSRPATHPGGTISKPRVVPPPRACHKWGCRARQTVNLAHGYAVTLWLGDDRLNYRSRPVIELLDRGVPVQWWISPQGDGWNGSLSCRTSGPEPNCDLIDSLGMHADVAEMVILRAGRLTHPAGAQAITNSVGMRAADLNGDGYLDVIGISNDYRPNFARGHNYWQTFRYRHDRLVLTGCALQRRNAPAPTHLLAGACPTV